MDLLRAWTGAVVVLVCGSVITTGLAVSAVVSDDDLKPVTGALLWIALPALIVFALTALAGALLHPLPQRADAGRHALAVLLVPGLATLLGIAVGIVQGSPAQSNAAGAVGGLLGAVATWWLLTRLRGRRTPRGGYTGY
ncbi:hypothetical protein AB0H37_37155 [Actinomadura sp. NPDC023710]|uniref:hypothetical protein n=1 Tax=Actinomadura sp. NPDC023710 TaxID=3158219 RepID=UPI0033E37C2F